MFVPPWGWFPLLNHDFQGSVAGLGRDEIYPDKIHGWSILDG